MRIKDLFGGKWLMFAMLFVVSSMALVSCGSDDDDVPEPSVIPNVTDFVGTWDAIPTPYSGSNPFRLTLNGDMTASYDNGFESHSYDGMWKYNASTLTVWDPEDNTGLDFHHSWFYRLIDGILYLYHDAEEYEADEPDFICKRVKPGDDDSGNDDGSYSGALLGSWGMSGYIEGEGYCSTTMTFKANGKCTIQETSDGETYSVNLDFTVSGNIEDNALLRLKGKTVDGDNYDNTYSATIYNNVLTLVGLTGEANGDYLELRRL